MTRNKMIEMLVDSDFHYIQSGEPGGLELLQSYLEFGFKGYNNFTDNELMYELEERGILCENLEIELDDISHINE